MRRSVGSRPSDLQLPIQRTLEIVPRTLAEPPKSVLGWVRSRNPLRVVASVPILEGMGTLVLPHICVIDISSQSVPIDQHVTGDLATRWQNRRSSQSLDYTSLINCAFHSVLVFMLGSK